MIRRPRLVRSLAWAVVAAGLVGLPPKAAADPVYGDFDRDGLRDVVTVLQRGPDSTLQVWLSATQSLRVLRLSAPILKVGAFDLDGDGRPEIVASDISAGVHVWRGTKRGHLKHVRPRKAQPDLVSAGSPGVGKQAGDNGDDLIPGSDWTLAVDAADPLHLSPPASSTPVALRRSPPVLDRTLGSSGSRAPPLSR
ncbi:MAG TPA: VCBS repeat-containing protein [Vicinamibacterales bacterium]|nr:VCBS repeat-containing protein [Vicinamibacterales bacterium]